MRAFGILLAIFCFCHTAHAETRLALVIGNSRYETIAPLRNPENDIEVVSESLEAVGFEVERLSNADGARMLQSISDLSSRAAKADRPTVVIYFAGHGIQRDGRNYLLPVDFEADDLGDIATRSVELEKVITQLKQAHAGVQMVILDSCRNDPFERTERAAVPIEPGFAKVDDATGTLIAFSTAPGKTASDGETGTSPYASAFAETILLPGLPVQTTFERIRTKVRERTRSGQEPWENSALYGEFKFVPDAAPNEIGEVEALLWDNVALLDLRKPTNAMSTAFRTAFIQGWRNARLTISTVISHFASRPKPFRSSRRKTTNSISAGKMPTSSAYPAPDGS